MASKDNSLNGQDLKKLQFLEPEFSRKRTLLQINRGLEEFIEATPDERAALAKRFSLIEVKKLTCSFVLNALPEARVAAKGQLHAHVVQSCIITNEPVEEVIQEEFTLRFVPRKEMIPDESLDIEALLAADYDEVPYDGRTIDIVEAASEQLALALDPYPRKQGEGLEEFVDAVPEDENLQNDEKEKPFSVLSRLKEIKKKG